MLSLKFVLLTQPVPPLLWVEDITARQVCPEDADGQRDQYESGSLDGAAGRGLSGAGPQLHRAGRIERVEQQRDDYLEHADNMLEQVERILRALEKAERLDEVLEEKHAQIKVGARLIRAVCTTRAR